MNRKVEVEARLERSLRNQVRAPKLGRGFDAAVWARIENAGQQARAPLARKPSTASRWMLASNVIGIAVALALIVFIGAQEFSGGGIDVSLPQVAPGLVDRIVAMMIWPVTLIALGFGLMFTSLGRRLREFF
jgi:hypothetical protein